MHLYYILYYILYLWCQIWVFPDLELCIVLINAGMQTRVLFVTLQ